MTKLIRTNTSSKKRRGVRKIDPRKIRELETNFQNLEDKWANVPKFSGKYTVKVTVQSKVVLPTKNNEAESLVRPKAGKFDVGVGALPPQKVYTGSQVKGIAVMHKSCLQPVFTDEQAKDSAKMRRG